MTTVCEKEDGEDIAAACPFPIGDGCLCWPLGDRIDIAISVRVHRFYRALKADARLQELGVSDVVPAYNAVAVYFDPGVCDAAQIRSRVDAVARENKGPEIAARGDFFRIPAVYDGEDLDRVARLSGLSVDEVIRIHAEGDYIVAMIGFQPHFPYLIGLDARLATPRLATPRTRIPAGAIAIGGAQTGIYPSESPGGWNLIGRTRPELLKVVKPGDRIRFEAVNTLDQACASGPQPVEGAS